MRRASLMFCGFLGGVFLLAGLEALTFLEKARWYPLAVCGAGTIMCAMEFVRIWRSLDGRPGGQEAGASIASVWRSTLPYWGWIAGYYVLILVAGFSVASALFTLAMLRRLARVGWLPSLIGSVAVVAALHFLAGLFALDWPRGLLGDIRF